MTARVRNEPFNVLSALGNALKNREYPWTAILESIATAQHGIASAFTMPHTGLQRMKDEASLLRDSFQRHIGYLDQAGMAQAAVILSRHYLFGSIVQLLREVLPGGNSLTIAALRDGGAAVEEMYYRVNVLPTLSSITIDKPRWFKWLKDKGVADDKTAAFDIFGADAFSEINKTVWAKSTITLYFTSDEKAVLTKLTV